MVGYKFSQIGGAFLVHYSDLDSNSCKKWNEKPEVVEDKQVTHNLIGRHADEVNFGQIKRARVDRLFLYFKRWLNASVEDDSRTPKCEDVKINDNSFRVHPSKKEGNYDDGDVEEESDDNKKM
jgi:hypothetical protein